MQTLPDSIRLALDDGLDLLPFTVSDRQRQQFFLYLELLNHWNQVHNLTAVRDPLAQISRHILDSLAVLPFLPQDGSTLADIGSGAGLPALMFAIMRPDMTIYPIESNKKKSSFIRQAAIKLSLPAVKTLSLRVENWQPEAPIDIIISRALASAETFIDLSGHLGNSASRWFIMKGQKEEDFSRAHFELVQQFSVTVPNLDETRSLLEIHKKNTDSTMLIRGRR